MNPLTQTPDLATLRGLFKGLLITDTDGMEPFLTDWRKRWVGKAYAVVQPDTPEDVAHVVRWCRDEKVSVVPQGGNTGLSGGATPANDGNAIVLSLARLNRIEAIDTLNNTVVVQAGVVLQRLQEAALAADRLFPLSLAAQGSCTIGGNLSTNAGGVQVLRYGNTRALCLGLQVVTPEGEIWDGLRGLRKDNTGYDLKDLFIGAEGTLGVITAAVMQVFPLPKGRTVAVVAVESVNAAMQLFDLARAQVGANLTAFELISERCLALVLKHFPGCRRPLSTLSPWVLLIEVSSLHSTTESADQLTRLLKAALEQNLLQDATLSESHAQAQAFWALRESISEAQGHEGKNIKHDIAIPISDIAQFVEIASTAITRTFPGTRMVVFGHLGDGNLHFNVSPAEGVLDPIGQTHFMAQQDAINRLTHDLVAQFKGSISAEHGLGVLRRDEAARYKSPVELRLMYALKSAFDPHNLMNPGKVLAQKSPYP
jgi:FAD/FMN-containing dehydrogenase